VKSPSWGAPVRVSGGVFIQAVEIKGDTCLGAVREFGTADAAWDFAQAVGNGAIVNSLTCGRPYCDGGQAVQKLERIRRRMGRPRNGRAKASSLPASTVESGSGRARIAKGRRGSDAVARVTGRNQCSPLPLFWAGSCMFFPPDSNACRGFLAQIVVRLHPKLLCRSGNGRQVLCLQCDPCLWLWNPACTPCDVNQM
jgi:hypothetical protein